MRKTQKRLSEQERLEVIEKYKTGNYTCRDLGKQYYITSSVIGNLLKKNGIPAENHKVLNRKYTLNEEYFDVIDTEEKAYFLGFLYADGCVSTLKHKITIGLQEKDVEILNKFAQMLETNQPLYFEERTSKCSTWQNAYILSINSKKLRNSLINLGCVPNKTHILKFPTEDQVPSHLIRHFIRGYFDGDGSFTYTLSKEGTHRLMAKIVGNFDFLDKLKIIWNSLDGVNSTICEIGTTKNIVQLSSGGRVSSLRLLNWLYLDCNIFLKRKYDKYLDIADFFKVNNLDKSLRQNKSI